MSRLLFSEYKTNENGYTQIPPRALNGGLYTGEPFYKNSPWGNVPVIPDSGYMIHYNLKTANPPTEALYHYPGGGTRPGNNYANMIGVNTNDQYNIAGNVLPCKREKNCNCRKCKFSKYSYL